MKYLTEEETKWKGVDYYVPLKPKWNKDEYGLFWQTKYCPKPSVGAMVWMCDTWKPNSYEEFYNMYITKTEGHDKIHRGRTLEELEDIAINWQNDVKDYNTPLSEYFDAVILHTVVETYMGVHFENKAIEAMESTDKYIIERGTDEEDSAMSIDFKVFNKINGKKGKLLYFVQVKPLSFITGYRNHTVKDRINAFSKHRKGNEMYPGIPYYYLIYDADTNKWVYNPDTKRCRFEYKELVKDNGYGTPIRNKKKMKEYESDSLFNNN